jgi:hypothetical protein
VFKCCVCLDNKSIVIKQRNGMMSPKFTPRIISAIGIALQNNWRTRNLFIRRITIILFVQQSHKNHNYQYDQHHQVVYSIWSINQTNTIFHTKFPALRMSMSVLLWFMQSTCTFVRRRDSIVLLGPFQKFCVWFYCNNKILDKNTIDIPECLNICPLLNVITSTVHTLFPSTW